MSLLGMRKASVDGQASIPANLEQPEITAINNKTNRRKFLWMSAAASAGASVMFAPALARADYHQPIDFELTGEYEWTDDYNRRNIIHEAMWIINRRFLDIENVAQNVLDVASNGYAFQDSAWSNLKPHYPDLSLGDQLLWYQLLTIRNWMSPPDPQPGPKLYILSASGDQNAFGWAPYDTVTVSGDGDQYQVTGDFKIELNFKILGGGGLNSDPWFWASIIAHEMLHNLGHQHPEPVNHPNYQRRQINAFTASLYYGNRTYRFGMRTPDVRCGGRHS